MVCICQDDVVNASANHLEPGTNLTLIAPFPWDTPSVIKAMIFVSITLCTIIGNGMVLLAMLLNRKTLKSSTHYFIASLSLADFLVGVLVMPFLAVLSVTGRWYFGQGYCVAFHCIHYWLCSASIFSITAICLERYIGVRYPLEHFKFMNNQRVLQACFCVWTIAGVLSVGPLFIWPEPFPENDPYACPVNFQLGHVITVMVFMFYIPCTIMIGFYLQIYCIASAHLKSISDRRKKTHGVNSSSTDSGIHGKKKNGKELSSGSTHFTSTNSNSQESSQDFSSGNSCEMVDGKNTKSTSARTENVLATNRQKQTSLSKKLFLVVGAFFLCYFPFFTTFMVKKIEDNLVPVQLFIALGWIRYFNSCLNPMIYAAMLKPFRDAFNDIFNLILCRKR